MVTRDSLTTIGYVVKGSGSGTTHAKTSSHYRMTANETCGHTVGNSQYGPTVKELTITAGADTIYLPYWQNCISSVVLPTTGPSFFVTDNMSGCCLYLGTTNGGDLVAFHANSQTGSSESEMTGKPASFQSMDALRELDTLASTAKATVGVNRIVGGCGKAHYMQKVGKTTKADNWLGGTTIVGFRAGTNWEFWFQTWGSANGSGVMVQDCQKIYPTT